MKKLLFFLIVVSLSAASIPVDATNAWTKNQHDVQNTGQSPYVSFSNGSVLWTYSVNTGFDTASLDNNDIIYIPGDEIYALYPNGSLKTTYIVSTFSTTSPVVDNLNNVIYIYTSDKKLYSYYINGTLNWINQYLQTIYKNAIGSDDNTVYMLNNTSVTALNLDGSLKWVYADVHLSYQISGMAIDPTNNALILTNWTHLISLDRTNGNLNWGSIINTSMSAGGASPVIYKGHIYYTTEYAVLYSFNLDGTENWNYTASPTGASYSGASFSPNDDSIYFGTEAATAGGENLWSVFSNGTLKWTANITTPNHYTQIYCNILVDANDVIYFTTKDITGQPDYNVFAVYGNNGTIKWQYFDSLNWQIGAYDSTASLSISSTGVLYLLDSNQLIAFNSPSPPIVCPVGWCYLTGIANKTLFELDAAVSDDTIQGRYNSTSKQYQNHRTGYSFNENVIVSPKEGYYYYFTAPKTITPVPGSTPSITLKQGWNLVGNYGSSARTLAELKLSIGATATKASYYDKTLKKWIDADNRAVPAMESFMAYVITETVWAN